MCLPSTHLFQEGIFVFYTVTHLVGHIGLVTAFPEVATRVYYLPGLDSICSSAQQSKGACKETVTKRYDRLCHSVSECVFPHFGALTCGKTFQISMCLLGRRVTVFMEHPSVDSQQVQGAGAQCPKRAK